MHAHTAAVSVSLQYHCNNFYITVVVVVIKWPSSSLPPRHADNYTRNNNTTMTDGFRTECSVNGAGDRHHWPIAFGASRRPNKKFMTVRRPVGRVGEGPDFRKPGNGMLQLSTSSSPLPPSPSQTHSSTSSSTPSTQQCYYEPFRRPNPNNVETCEAIEWEVMSKHFARWTIWSYIFSLGTYTYPDYCTAFQGLIAKIIIIICTWHVTVGLGKGEGGWVSRSRLNFIVFSFNFEDFYNLHEFDRNLCRALIWIKLL